MVLATRPGGAVRAGRTPTCLDPGAPRAEGGSQALEFAMVLPLLGLLLGLLAQTGLLLADVVVVQGIAREVARTAAVDGDERARQIAGDLAGDRRVRVRLTDDDGLVAAQVQVATRAFAAVGVNLWLPARAVFRREALSGPLAGG